MRGRIGNVFLHSLRIFQVDCEGLQRVFGFPAGCCFRAWEVADWEIPIGFASEGVFR